MGLSDRFFQSVLSANGSGGETQPRSFLAASSVHRLFRLRIRFILA